MSSCADETHGEEGQKEHGSAFCEALCFQEPLSQLYDTVIEVLWLENGPLPSSSKGENLLFFTLFRLMFSEAFYYTCKM